MQAGEIKKMLGGEHDRKNAIVTIHPRAGGARPGLGQNAAHVSALDGARGFKRELIDYSLATRPASRARRSRSSANAVGLLSAEVGVHRLVRICPDRRRASIRRCVGLRLAGYRKT